MIIVYWVSLKVKFWTGMHVSSRPFEYVHSSLWGPSRVRVDSWRGFCSYFLGLGLVFFLRGRG